YAVLDTTADGSDAVETHRVEYDVDRVAAAVREAGLPETTAERLYEGR
ncbi:metallophosphoesterase, partial [Halorubrum sp. SS5]